MNELSLLLESIASVLNAVCWPILVLAIIYLFKDHLREFLESMGEFTFKAGASGLEASAKRSEVAANLAVATAKSENGIADPDRVANAGRTVGAFSDKQLLRLVGKRVLWVDDIPLNNVYERRALETLGISVVTSPSTADAIEKVRDHDFDVIISDLSRPGDDEAGFTLLDKLNEQNRRTPYIIYSAHSTPELRQRARDKKAFGQTNIPEELFQMILNALLRSSDSSS